MTTRVPLDEIEAILADRFNMCSTDRLVWQSDGSVVIEHAAKEKIARDPIDQRRREEERFRTMTEAQREAELYKPGGPALIRADGSAIWV